MADSKHTKGPWYVGAQNDGVFIIDKPPRPGPADHPADIPGVTIIGKLYDNVFDDAGLSRARANAAMAAAAPDLFDALQALLHCPEIADCDPRDKDDDTVLAERKARAALLSARKTGGG